MTSVEDDVALRTEVKNKCQDRNPVKVATRGEDKRGHPLELRHRLPHWSQNSLARRNSGAQWREVRRSVIAGV